MPFSNDRPLTIVARRILAGVDLYLLLSLLVLASAAWLFLALADEVTEGDTHHIDASILRLLREPGDLSLPVGPNWLESFFIDLTALGGVAVLALVTLVVLGSLFIGHRSHAIPLVIGAIGGGTLLNALLKLWFDRPRPTVVPHLVEVASSSFPSGHSMNSAIVYLTLGAVLARLVQPLSMKLYILGVALLISFLVGISRVYLGVHYPSDVLAGWSLGLAWAVLWWLVACWLQRRGMVESAGSEIETSPSVLSSS